MVTRSYRRSADTVARPKTAVSLVLQSVRLTSGDEVLLTDHGYGANAIAASLKDEITRGGKHAAAFSDGEIDRPLGSPLHRIPRDESSPGRWMMGSVPTAAACMNDRRDRECAGA